jgi:hypothetical protein
VYTIIGIRRAVNDAAPSALSARPGRPSAQRNWELERARHELGELTEAVKAQATELALPRGSRLDLTGPLPARSRARRKKRFSS